jgi:hypothetical protein
MASAKPRPNPILKQWLDKGQAEYSAEWRRLYGKEPLFKFGQDRLLNDVERQWRSPLGGTAVEEKKKR